MSIDVYTDHENTDNFRGFSIIPNIFHSLQNESQSTPKYFLINGEFFKRRYYQNVPIVT